MCENIDFTLMYTIYVYMYIIYYIYIYLCTVTIVTHNMFIVQCKNLYFELKYKDTYICLDNYIQNIVKILNLFVNSIIFIISFEMIETISKRKPA